VDLGSSPSDYDRELLREFGRARVDVMMRSHLLDVDLLKDPSGFDAQVTKRRQRIESKAALATR
jgi:hypothetical protein